MGQPKRRRRREASEGERARGRGAKWLLLLLQLPTHPSNARVKSWRRLQQLGAVPLKNSAYVLPNSQEAREDLEWMKREITSAKGLASIFETNTLDAAEDEQIEAAFRDARQKDYQALGRDIALQTRRLAGRGSARGTQARGARRLLRGLADRLAQIRAIDFFAAPGGDEAAAALQGLEQRLSEPGASDTKAASGERLRALDYRNREWLTRPRPGVDRMASAWLIRRFIDERASFAFADRRDPRSSRQVPFDMFGTEFGHQGGLCTFEVMADRFHVTGPAIKRIAEIVHDLDLKDERYGAPEASTIRALIDGLQRRFPDDHQLLEQGIVLFDDLYHSMGERAPASAQTPRASAALRAPVGSPRRG